MKNSLLPLLITSLLIYASFSLVMMNHMDAHNNCPLQVAGDVNCSQVQSPLDFAASHLNAASKFFSTIPTKTFAVSLVSLLALAFTTLFGLNKRPFVLRPSFVRSSKRTFVPPDRIRFNHWFALHENSPAFTEGR